MSLAADSGSDTLALEELRARVDVIEEGYEFFLAYAAQGLTTDASGDLGGEIRDWLRRYDTALTGLDEAFRAVLPATQDVEVVLAVLCRDADATRAFIRLVAAQESVSSLLIDNLNASVHLRAMLTDVFVLGELAQV